MDVGVDNLWRKLFGDLAENRHTLKMNLKKCHGLYFFLHLFIVFDTEVDIPTMTYSKVDSLKIMSIL